MKNLRSISYFMAVGVLGLALGACSMFSGHETSGQYVDDTTITTKVKAQIFDDPSLKVLQVNVETMKGVVQLSGFVDSRQNEAKAVSIAQKVRGVVSVKDDLVVR
ncbi:MAG: BON domain-containing protein [Bdellovibrionales bacterium]